MSAFQLFSEFSIWKAKSAFELETRWNCPCPQERLYVNKDKLSPYNNPASLIQSLLNCLSLRKISTRLNMP